MYSQQCIIFISSLNINSGDFVHIEQHPENKISITKCDITWANAYVLHTIHKGDIITWDIIYKTISKGLHYVPETI
jgi:hypothetical protein